MELPNLRLVVAEVIRWALRPPSQPGELIVQVIGENAMARKNVTRFNPAPLPDGNPEGVIGYQFRVEIVGGDTIFYHQFATSEFVNIDIDLEQGIEVKVTLIALDQAMNPSEPRVLQFTPTDVTPPHMPGALSVEVVGEHD